MSDQRRFKVLNSGDPLAYPRVPPDTIPWAFAETFRQQAYRNHSQTLERLNERGGLSWAEIQRAMTEQGLFIGKMMSNQAAKPLVLAAIDKWIVTEAGTLTAKRINDLPSAPDWVSDEYGG